MRASEYRARYRQAAYISARDVGGHARRRRARVAPAVELPARVNAPRQVRVLAYAAVYNALRPTARDAAYAATPIPPRGRITGSG